MKYVSYYIHIIFIFILKVNIIWNLFHVCIVANSQVFIDYFLRPLTKYAHWFTNYACSKKYYIAFYLFLFAFYVQLTFSINVIIMNHINIWIFEEHISLKEIKTFITLCAFQWDLKGINFKMSENEIRKPIQKRSIEKKDKIIKEGFKLICQKGYYNTNTAEIAKAASVSTGIVYQYFNDKHDILIEGIKKYAADIFYPMLSVAKDVTVTKENLRDVINKMITEFTKNHIVSKKAHEEITAMIHSDKDIANFFREHEMYMNNSIVEVLENSGFNIPNINEKVHISINLVDDLCHEIVYHKHSEMNYDVMTNTVIDIIVELLLNE